MFISNSTNVRLADVVSHNHRVVINSFIGNFLQNFFRFTYTCGSWSIQYSFTRKIREDDRWYICDEK